MSCVGICFLIPLCESFVCDYIECFTLHGLSCRRSPFKSGTALASRLCKAAMLHRFKLVAKEAQRPELLATSSYSKAKVTLKWFQIQRLRTNKISVCVTGFPTDASKHAQSWSFIFFSRQKLFSKSQLYYSIKEDLLC